MEIPDAAFTAALLSPPSVRDASDTLMNIDLCMFYGGALLGAGVVIDDGGRLAFERQKMILADFHPTLELDEWQPSPFSPLSSEAPTFGATDGSGGHSPFLRISSGNEATKNPQHYTYVEQPFVSRSVEIPKDADVVVFERCRFVNGLDVSRRHIGATLVFYDCDFRFLFTLGVAQADDNQWWPMPSVAHRIHLRNIVVNGDIDCAGVIVEPKSRPSLSDRAVAPLSASDESLTAVTLRQSTVGGDIRFCSRDVAAHLENRFVADNEIRPLSWRRPLSSGSAHLASRDWPTDADNTTSIWGDLDLRSCDVGGSVDLRNIRVGRRIRLDEAKVAHAVCVDGSLPDSFGPLNTRLSTHCASFEFHKLECRGDVILTGLRAQAADGWHDDRSERLSNQHLGRIIARGARIDGAIHLDHPSGQITIPVSGPHHDVPPAYCDADIDFAGISADRLVISGHIFSKRSAGEGPTDDRARMILSGAKLRQLDLREWHHRIDLSGSTIQSWAFGVDGNGEPVPRTSARFIGVLANMKPLDRSMWVSVETELRNCGQDREADQVYVALRNSALTRSVAGNGVRATGRKEAARERAGADARRAKSIRVSAAIGSTILWFRNLLERFHGRSMAFGTAPGRLLIGSAILFSLMVAVVSNPTNVTLSPAAIQNIASRCRGGVAGQPPDADVCRIYFREALRAGWALEIRPVDVGADWSLRRRLALAVRYTVPIVGVTGDSEWIPSRRPTLYVGAMSKHMDFSAESLAFWVALYNWFAIPLAIGFWTARALHKS